LIYKRLGIPEGGRRYPGLFTLLQVDDKFYHVNPNIN